MAASPEPSWARRSRIFALVAGVCAALLGATALAGLFLNVEALKCIVPGSTPLKLNIAAGLSNTDKLLATVKTAMETKSEA